MQLSGGVDGIAVSARCWRAACHSSTAVRPAVGAPLSRYGDKVLVDPEEIHDGSQRRTQVFEAGRDRRLDVLIVHLAEVRLLRR
jgi:hypothetical protein